MTIKHVSAVLEGSGFPSVTHFAVLVKCAQHADRKGVIRATQTEIASDIGLSRRVVAQRFADFVNAGLLFNPHPGRYQFEADAVAMVDELVPLSRREKPVPNAPGAEEEADRLRQNLWPNQGIVWERREEGMWPVVNTFQ